VSRILVDPQNIRGRKLHLNGPPARHVLQVLRKKAGDLLEITDGQGRNYAIRLESAVKNALVGAILQEENKPPAYSGPCLFQAIPKSQRMDWVIEKAVELGAGAIWPLWTKRSVVIPRTRDVTAKLDRWRRIAGEALAQSGGTRLCEIHTPCALGEAAFQINPSHLTLVAWEKEKSKTLKDVLRNFRHSREGGNPGLDSHSRGNDVHVNIFIGPEGGFAPEEIELLKKRGGQTVSLGLRTLRSETAPLMILSAILYESLL
jgi:16S rRNA (uracil1498-N3)-methyltransferase